MDNQYTFIMFITITVGHIEAPLTGHVSVVLATQGASQHFYRGL